MDVLHNEIDVLDHWTFSSIIFLRPPMFWGLFTLPGLGIGQMGQTCISHSKAAVVPCTGWEDLEVSARYNNSVSSLSDVFILKSRLFSWWQYLRSHVTLPVPASVEVFQCYPYEVLSYDDAPTECIEFFEYVGSHVKSGLENESQDPLKQDSCFHF